MYFLAISDSWVARWLTPVWLMGMGVLAGIVLILLFLAVVTVLSRIPFLDQIRKKGWTGHVLAAIVAVASSLGFYLLASPLRVDQGRIQTDELSLMLIASAVLGVVFGWGLVFCSNRRFVGEIRSLLTEGIGYYLSISMVTMAALGFGCTFVADDPFAILRSLPQVFASGAYDYPEIIPGNKSNADDPDYVPLNIPYNPSLLQRIVIQSDRNVTIGDNVKLADFKMLPVQVESGQPLEWTRTASQPAPIPTAENTQIHVQNREFDDALVTFTIVSFPEHPEVWSMIVFCFVTFVIGLLVLVPEGVAQRTSAIGLAAAKSEIGQPLFAILMVIGGFIIFWGVWFPFYTFGEDIRFLKDCGITIILILGLFQGVWSASSSVSEEIEGRTALTVLSKPVHRFSFISGKMFGVCVMLALMFVVLGFALLVAVAYKPIYEARENSLEQPIWQVCNLELMSTLPGLIMAYFQAVTLSCFAVAFATRLPQLANFAVCFSLYLIGHLTQSLVHSADSGFAIIQFVGQLIAVIVPDLEHFSMQAAIDAGNPVPIQYVAGAMVYSLLYTALALLLGLLLFEDRDLA